MPHGAGCRLLTAYFSRQADEGDIAQVIARVIERDDAGGAGVRGEFGQSVSQAGAIGAGAAQGGSKNPHGVVGLSGSRSGKGSGTLAEAFLEVLTQRAFRKTRGDDPNILLVSVRKTCKS